MLKLVSTFIYLFSYCGLVKRVASTSLLSTPAFDTQPRHFLFSAICHDCRHALQKRCFHWNFHLIIAHFNFIVSLNDVTIAATRWGFHSISFKMGSPLKKVGDHWSRESVITASGTQDRNQGASGRAKPPRKFFSSPGKICWTSFKTIGHSSKKLGPSQKTLRPSWCPKLVTGLLARIYGSSVKYVTTGAGLSWGARP